MSLTKVSLKIFRLAGIRTLNSAIWVVFLHPAVQIYVIHILAVFILTTHIRLDGLDQTFCSKSGYASLV